MKVDKILEQESDVEVYGKGILEYKLRRFENTHLIISFGSDSEITIYKGSDSFFSARSGHLSSTFTDINIGNTLNNGYEIILSQQGVTCSAFPILVEEVALRIVELVSNLGD